MLATSHKGRPPDGRVLARRFMTLTGGRRLVRLWVQDHRSGEQIILYADQAQHMPREGDDVWTDGKVLTFARGRLNLMVPQFFASPQMRLAS